MVPDVRATAKVLLSVSLIVLGLVALALLTVVIAFTLLDETNGEVESSGRHRTYLLYVPDSYDAATPTPLVICPPRARLAVNSQPASCGLPDTHTPPPCPFTPM